MKFLTPSHRALYKALTPKRKRQVVVITLLSVVAALAEIASIGALVPFIGLITNPDLITSNVYVAEVIRVFAISSEEQVIALFASLFSIVVLASGGLRYTLLWTQTAFSFAVGADLVKNIYQKKLHQNYEVHLKENTSETIATITIKVREVVNQTIGPVITLISSILLLSSILIFLFYLDPYVALWTLVLFGSMYALIAVKVKSTLAQAGITMTENQDQIVKNLQEGLGGIRHVLADSAQKYFLDRFVRYDAEARAATVKIIVTSQAPKYVVESVGLVLVALVAYLLIVVLGRADDAIITLGALALGAQRMMPMLQQAYWSYSQLMGGGAAVDHVVSMLSESQAIDVEVMPVNFGSSIKISDLNFKYAESQKNTLQGVNLKVQKGQRIGIVGETGSGKSTLVDLIMGLLSPSSGEIQVDDTNIHSEHNVMGWRKNICHVPQDIFLCDGTIVENVAFGIECTEVDHAAVDEAVKIAQLSEFIAKLPNGLHTIVGERGSSLSGGQRQRIGIARALYKRQPILVLDEATSALDLATEARIIEEINGLGSNLTILMIAHRIDTLRTCEQIWEVKDSNVRVFKDVSEYQKS